MAYGAVERLPTENASVAVVGNRRASGCVEVPHTATRFTSDDYRLLCDATGCNHSYDALCLRRFNSQSLVAAMTEVKAIGGRAWPSVLLKKPEWAYATALWCNSSLGLLCHWWVSNKTQNGRGSVTVTTIPSIPTLNVSTLTAKQHAVAKAKFELLKDKFLLPFNQIDADENRAAIDRALIVDVLGLPEALCAANGPLEALRNKLAAEPQIHGGKKSKVSNPDDQSLED